MPTECSVDRKQLAHFTDITHYYKASGMREGVLGRVKGGLKVCPQCTKNKSVETGYYKCGDSQKCMSWCKDCCKRLRPQSTEYFKKYYQEHKQQRVAKDRKHRYGVTQEMFDTVFELQDKACGVCGSTEPASKNGWHTDHSHETKQFRGVLCSNCNALLGFAKDSTSTLLSAVNYL